MKTVNILIGGEAGQGLVTIGTLLSKIIARSNYNLVATQDYQSRIRGGHNTFSIRMSAEEISAPQEKCDLIVAFNKETIDLHQHLIGNDGLILIDESLKIEGFNIFAIPYKNISSTKTQNIASVGIISSLLGIDEKIALKCVEEYFFGKDAQIIEENLKVFSQSKKWCDEQKLSFPKLEKIEKTFEKLMMNGSEAMALGAAAAGIKFAAFYPMTPATPLNLALVKMEKDFPLIVEQVEDEISAINMAIGASFAGAPSMVATSGGGFALMVEGVSLAGMTETPIVITVAQRPGPATGLPTRTEQADLEMVLYAGHGEFPRAIFAPGSIEECFQLTTKAFHLAEMSQSPIFILTDQFIADSYRTVSPFDLSKIKPIFPMDNMENPPDDYKRFEINDSGVSKRLLPGISKHLVVADSDEHTQDGHLTEDLKVRVQMVNKRLLKSDLIEKIILPPEFVGKDSSDLLLISWGSTRGSVIEAGKILNDSGKNISVLHFSQVWPLNPNQFMDKIKKAKRIISVEGNATGQFARLLKQETGVAIKDCILRYDGLPITPNYIINWLELLEA